MLESRAAPIFEESLSPKPPGSGGCLAILDPLCRTSSKALADFVLSQNWGPAYIDPEILQSLYLGAPKKVHHIFWNNPPAILVSRTLDMSMQDCRPLFDILDDGG